MFIKKKIIDDIEIYIKRDQVSIDATYKLNDKETSFINYGPYYSLMLFEYEDKLYLIRRCEKDTVVIPVVICADYVTYGKLTFDTVRGYLSDNEVENMFNKGILR